MQSENLSKNGHKELSTSSSDRNADDKITQYLRKDFTEIHTRVKNRQLLWMADHGPWASEGNYPPDVMMF